MGQQEKKKKKESMRKCGQCGCGLSKPEETIQFVCNKKETGDLHLKSGLLTKMKKTPSVLLQINTKSAFMTFYVLSLS